MENSIVIYRSKSEQLADEWWMDHPNFQIGVGICFLLFFVFVFGKVLYGFFKRD